VIRACFYAAEATDASFFSVNELCCGSLSFRVVAPPTVQRAAFEEYGGPNARAVMR